jgi:hypothetical protein
VGNAFELFFIQHLGGDKKTIDSVMPPAELLDWLESRLDMFYSQLKGELARDLFRGSYQVLVAVKNCIHRELQAKQAGSGFFKQFS